MEIGDRGLEKFIRRFFGIEPARDEQRGNERRNLEALRQRDDQVSVVFEDIPAFHSNKLQEFAESFQR